MPKPQVDPRFFAFRNAVYSDLKTAGEMLASDPGLLRVRNGIGETVMHFLVVENGLETVAWLIGKGAEVDTKNEFGQTPLMEAASLGLIEMCRLLIAHGANFRYLNSREESVFSAAAESDQAEALEYLLGLLLPGENINPFFSNVDAEMALSRSPKSAALLTPRGLTRRWP